MQVQELQRTKTMSHLPQDLLDTLLKRGKLYQVGGAVRDKFMGNSLSVKDQDYLVTGIEMDDLKSLLNKFGRVDLVGQSFGVLKFTPQNSQTFDFSLPRKEFSTGEGHRDFSVEFDSNLSVEEDLTRRDFTINAIAVDLATDEVIDPLGGMEDIKNKKIRIVYQESFKDDPLRMLRAVQFVARFDFDLEDNTYKMLKENAELIKTISPERISEELNKLLELSDKPSVGFRLMKETGLLEYVLPDFQMCVGVEQPGGFHKYDVFEHTLYTMDAAPRNLRIRLATLFHDINKPQTKRPKGDKVTFYSHEVHGAKTTKEVMKDLRYSNELANDVSKLVACHMYSNELSDKGLRRLVRKVGVDLIFDLFELRRADIVGQGMDGTFEVVDQLEARVREEMARKAPFSFADMAISGQEIIKTFHLPEGKIIGEILDHLLEAVLDNPEDNELEKLKDIAKKYIETNEDKGN